MAGVVKKELGWYENYNMVVYIDAAKQEHYAASSPYLLQGYITVVSDTLEGLKKQIDWVNARVKLLAILDRERNTNIRGK